MIFLTGATADYEDILDWFISNFTTHLSQPLFIVDFGLNKEYPNTIKIDWKNNAWFYKPRAILEAPSDKVCWIDVDCEIRADISDIFKMSEGYDLGLTKDWKRRSCEWATGLVCCQNKSSLEKWVNLTEKQTHRGDQESFEWIKHRYRIKELPREYQWLRLEGDNENAKVMHWTGEIGKRIIREKINALSNG